MENINKTPATPESVWEILMENARQMEKSRAEADRRDAEADKRNAEADKRNAEADKRNAEADKRSAEADKRSAETSRQIKELKEMIGGMANSNGMFAEEFFFNAIDNSDKKLFGEQFHECISSVKRYNKGKQKRSEQDVLLVNCNSVAIVEVKYKARKEDIQKLIDRPPVFKVLYPEYQTHRIYLGLAAMSFDAGVEDETIKNGIAIIKQVGDTIVISDENLKVF